MNGKQKTIAEYEYKLSETQRLIYAIVAVVGFIVIGIMGYGFYTGDRMNTMYTPLVDAAMEIKLEVTAAHLWLEEIISGDRYEDMATVWKHLEQADWYAEAMLEGGENPAGVFIPLDDNKMSAAVIEVQGKIADLREITKQRIAAKETSGIGTAIDQRYDHIFKTFIIQVDEVESRLQRVMMRDRGRFRYTQVFLMAVCLLLFVFFGVVLHRFERSKAKSFRAIKETKKNLETEIDERKQTEVLLQKSESRYRGLFEESPVSLWEEDFSAVKTYIDQLRSTGISDFRSYFESHPESVRECAQRVKIIEVNRETLKMFQAESTEQLFENLDKVFVKKSYDAFKTELIYLAEGKDNFELQAFSQTLQGNEIQIILRLTLVPGCENTWSKVLISLSDVTKRMEAEAELLEYRNHLEELVEKRTEELKEKTEKVEKSSKALTYLLEDVNKSRGELQKMNIEYDAANKELKEFAYIVSHDLKAPLRAISQLTHWISEDYSELFDNDGKEQMALILQRVKRMDGLIDGILRYSRVGRIQEKEERLDLNLLVKEVIENIAPPGTIQILFEDTLPVVWRDPTRMAQVFQNLLGNSIKFMDKKEGIIRVGCVDDGTFWKFNVSDNGPGIDQRYYGKIFQIFQTLTSRDEHESTGIGLTLVKKIIHLYGGSVWVESELGKGATFFFTLPKQGGKDEKL